LSGPLCRQRSGLAAGAVQINVRVAPGVPPGEQAVVVAIGDTGSQAGVTVVVE